MPEENPSLTIKVPLPKFFSSKGTGEHKTSHTHSKVNKLYFVAISAFFFFCFVGFSFLVKSKMLVQFDFNTTVRIQEHVPIRLDPFFSFLSFLGNFEAATVILCILLLLRRKILGIFVVGMYGLAHVVEIVGKNFLDHPGPPKFMLRSLSSDFPQFYVYTKGSYPSGHSLRMMIILLVAFSVITVSKKIPKSMKIPLYCAVILYAALMLFSRISLGEHWISDVIAGSFLGLCFGFFSLIFL